MLTSISFFQVTFFAIIFCMLLFCGLYLMLVHKSLSSAREMQKTLGITFILLSVNLLTLGYYLNLSDDLVSEVIPFVIAIADLLAVVLFIYKMYKQQDATAKVSQAPAVTTAQAVAVEEETVAPVSAEQEQQAAVADEDADDSAIVETDNKTELKEADAEEPLENPNLEDMIFFQRVESLMATKRLFCEQEISREAVAAAVGTNRTYLTRSIKGATGKTFLEYITGLRTSYAATLLTSTDEPLDIIGTMSGFRSKSSYYRAFSAAYGCTPSEYRKR